MVKHEHVQLSETALQGQSDPPISDPSLFLPQDAHPDPLPKTIDDSDDRLENGDDKKEEAALGEEYPKYLSSKDQDYASDDQLIHENETILSIPTGQSEERRRDRSRMLCNWCCFIWDDFRLTKFRAKGLLLTIIYYASLVTGWILAITWLTIADSKNYWLPMGLLGSLVGSGIACSYTLRDWDKKHGHVGMYWNIVTLGVDILGFSMLRVISKEWRTRKELKLCQELSNVNFMSSYANFLTTSYTLAVSSSDQLTAFDPTSFIWVCWAVSLVSLVTIDTEEEEEDEEEWDRTYERIILFLFELTFILIGICTPLICVVWWPNIGLYGVVFGSIFLISLISWDLDESEHQTTLTTIGFTICLLVIGFAVVQLYIVQNHDFSSDANALATVGAVVAAVILGGAYIAIGWIAVEMTLSMLRNCNIYMRDHLRN